MHRVVALARQLQSSSGRTGDVISDVSDVIQSSSKALLPGPCAGRCIVFEKRLKLCSDEELPNVIEHCSRLALDRQNRPAANACADQTKWAPYLQRSHVGCTEEALQRLPQGGLKVMAETRTKFCRVIKSIGVESSYNVLNLGNGLLDNSAYLGDLAVGRWDENRDGLYDSPSQRAESRTVHVGCDLFDAAGTPVRAFYHGEIFLTGHYPGKCDYGFVVILKHVIDGQTVWSLHGHLEPTSLLHKEVGQQVQAGEVIGWIGRSHVGVNGGWIPHLHFQLTTIQPRIADLPGVVSLAHRAFARKLYPDPRLVLGQLWQ